jgi:hypothetical protein
MHRTGRWLSLSRILKRPRRLVSTVALAVGLVAVPTVSLAVTTDALPGDPLTLGQENKIANATTTLTGTDAATGTNTPNGVLQVRRESAQGAAVKVENKTQAGAGRGIDVQVATGQPPITVNPGAGKSNLNVDKLDGRDEEDFLNASRAYKKSSGLVTGLGGGRNKPISVRCEKNDIAIGFSAVPLDPDKVDIIRSISAQFTGYFVEFTDNDAASNFIVEVICSDNAKPFESG